MCVIINKKARKERKTMITSLQYVGVGLIFNVLDLVTGIISAIKEKDIQSSKLRDGLFKKIGFIICYLVSYIIDTKGDVIGFNIGVPVLPMLILYTCTTELVSIIENISKINPDLLPTKLMELFHIKKE